MQREEWGRGTRALAARVVLVVTALAAVLLAACAGEDGEPAGAVHTYELPFEPGPRVMQRLTRAQYVDAVHDLFGDDVVVVASALEPDAMRDGFFAIGAAQTSVSSRGVEQYERAAYQIASQVLAPERRDRVVTCASADDACAREVLAPIARRAWRRPVSDEELAVLVDVAVDAAAVLDDFHAGLEYALAAILQSPDFLYRPQVGIAGEEGRGWLDAYELATRLSFFLWNTIPDDALLAAAESGALDDPEGLDAEIDRLLASPRARAGVRAFADDWLQLSALADLTKDPTIFTAASPDLGPAAREGTLLTIEHFVFDLDGDYRDLMTTRVTFADRRLAALYVVRAPSSEGFGLVELPESTPRRGLLGQASILSMWAHPVSTSPTLRGRFVRETLLCQPVLPPPVGVDTAIPEPSAEARTLRERLAAHRANDFCAGCHAQLDPIGLGLEQFDGIGRFRTRDEDAPIDASGNLDGVAFEDASQLALALRDHPALLPCFVDRMMTYAGGHPLTASEEAAHQALTIQLARDGYRVRALMRAIARHPFFRGVSMDSEEGTP